MTRLNVSEGKIFRGDPCLPSQKSSPRIELELAPCEHLTRLDQAEPLLGPVVAEDRVTTKVGAAFGVTTRRQVNRSPARAFSEQ